MCLLRGTDLDFSLQISCLEQQKLIYDCSGANLILLLWNAAEVFFLERWGFSMGVWVVVGVVLLKVWISSWLMNLGVGSVLSNDRRCNDLFFTSESGSG